ncbi:MAG TPA: hypothetical protein VGC36_11710, partial [Rhizomicrobium sp.]
MTRSNVPRRPVAGFNSALLASSTLVALALLAVPPAAANPTGPTAVGGAPDLSGVVPGPVAVVGLTQPRTIIDWTGFDVDPGDTTKFIFGGKNWIVFNRVNGGSATIGGQLLGCMDVAHCSISDPLTAFGGNIWLYASDGIIVGPGGVIKSGGSLLTTSPMTTADADFLAGTEPTALQFDFGAAAAGTSVSMQAGAQIESSGGTIALVAPAVSTAAGSSVTAPAGSASALYGATNAYRIKFLQNGSNDLDLVSFEVPAGQAGGTAAAAPIALGGSTSAGNVYIAAVRQSSIIDALIDITGTVTAAQASTVGGNIVLSAGGITNNAAAAPDPASGRLGVTATAAITADNQVQIAATGAVSASAPVTARTLSGTSDGGADFGAANHVAEVGGFTNSGSGAFALNNAEAIAVAGPLTNTVGDISLTTTVGDVTITGTVDGTGHVVTIASAGGVSAAGGIVKAATLTGSSTGTAALTNAGNVIATLGRFSNSGGAF